MKVREREGERERECEPKVLVDGNPATVLGGSREEKGESTKEGRPGEPAEDLPGE